jgi:hypothetical protein
MVAVMKMLGFERIGVCTRKNTLAGQEWAIGEVVVGFGWGRQKAGTATRLVKPEIHLHLYRDRNRLAILGARLEGPISQGLDGLLVQSISQRL